MPVPRHACRVRPATSTLSFRFLVFVVLWGGLVCRAARTPSQMLAGGLATDDLAQALQTLGQDPSSAPVWRASTYPEPTLLSPSSAEALEAFVRAGGRAYVEFAQREDGQPLLGIETAPVVRRALHQRLIVTAELNPISGLRRGDLLEEHNSACLVPTKLPEGARPLLSYGTVIGTYRAEARQPGYVVTLDLGQPRDLVAVSQRYGAGQPNYYPEVVELWLGDSPDALRQAGALEAPTQPVVRFSFPPVRAQYVRLVCRKFRRSPVTDFLFLGEVQAQDVAGANVALHRPYVLSPIAPAGAYGDSGGELTDGLIDGSYEDGLSVGWVTEPSDRWEQWPALVEVPLGQGAALVAFTRLSDFRVREYRLTRRWEGLLRHIALFLVPPERRDALTARYVPLEAWTEPRAWAPTGSPATLHVRTIEGARVSASLDGKRTLIPQATDSGLYTVPLTLTEGQHAVRVVAATDRGRAEQTISIRVSDREAAYRRALDRNMAWFERSGVLPQADGSEGVWSQRCLAWLDGGPTEFLASPFRCDCNAATAQAFYLYGTLTGDPVWHARALNVTRSLLKHQYVDPTQASFGGWPWLYESDESIYFWDDNTRIAVALLWLYTQTGDEDILRAALRTAELCREVAQPDGLIARHVISASELSRLGREGFRRLPPQGIALDFDLKRWAWAYGVTGDPAYHELLRQAAAVWGSVAGTRGLPFTLAVDQDGCLRARLLDHWRAFVSDPSVRRYGAPLAGAGDYANAYTGDCSITTSADDPLTDQLYVTPHLLLQAWWAYSGTGDPACLEAFHALGDYLVRIQFESRDPRIDGAWLRGFDVEHWEVYGAPYDPAYGPYSAYTGWMNAFAATAFAQYLLKADPLPPKAPPSGRIAEILAQVRAERPPSPPDTSVAAGASYTLSVPPVPAYGDAGGELTDGVLDGPYADGRSVGWHLSEGQTLKVDITLDLGAPRRIGAVAQRHGAGRADYCPDVIEVSCGPSLDRLVRAAEVRRNNAGPGRRFIALPEPLEARYVRFCLTKRRTSPVTDFLFVGETEAFEEP